MYINSFLSLKAYCESQKFAGWDPFDGLNSIIFQSTPLKKWYLPRLILTQAFKRNPINLRRLLLIPKEYNPKGIGLFLHGYCNLLQYSRKTGDNTLGSADEFEEKINFLAQLLISLQSEGYSGACWGYNFDWQSRIFYQPKFTPTIVATSFCSDALFQAYNVTGDSKYRNIALSSAQFVINDLNHSIDSDGGIIFSYSPLDKSQVYNASLLGARLIAQCYYHKKNPDWLNISQKAAGTIANKQNQGGSWKYGEHHVQGWVDSFHTGYNLECLYEIMIYSGEPLYTDSFNKGFKFYLNNFFLDNGTPKYYNDRIYPIDIHSPAQFIATLAKTNKLGDNSELARKVLKWTITHMQSSKGFFYYQINPMLSSKIPYMRWAQAWMFYAMSLYFLHKGKNGI